MAYSYKSHSYLSESVVYVNQNSVLKSVADKKLHSKAKLLLKPNGIYWKKC